MTPPHLTLVSWKSADSSLSGWERPGDGQIVHFLHGNGFCSRTLWPLAQQLPSDWRLIFTDIPGHGGSARPSVGMPDWQGMARSIADQLQVLADGQPVQAVGHSMGGC
ncbi:alpha/beta fold hydrolase [Bacterioplanes sanyensis]|nr:alpha/beta hydrolase [Bacterioplanes sanyensis]